MSKTSAWFACDRDEFAAAIKAVSPVLPGIAVREELKCVLVRATPEGVSVSAASDQMAATVGMERFEAVGELASLVPPDRLLAMVSSMGGETFRAEADGAGLRLSSDAARFRLFGYPADRYLEPSVGRAVPASACVGQVSMRRLVDATAFAIGSEHPDATNGLLLEADGMRLRAVATNGRVCALATADAVCDARGRHAAIVPPKAAAAVLRMLGDEGDMEIGFGTDHASLVMRGGLATLRTSLVAGTFAPYGRLLERPQGCSATVSARSLYDAMGRASLTIDPKLSPGAIVDVGEDGATTIRSRSVDAGESDVSMRFSSVEGGAARFCVQPLLVLSALRASGAGDADVRVDVGAPNYIRVELGDGTLYVIGKQSMPKESE